MIRGVGLAALVLLGRVAFAQTPAVVVRDAGPGPMGRFLENVLRQPSTTVIVADTVRIPADSAVPGALVIIAQRAFVAGRVGGDLVVVGGDLFIRPKALIDGEAIAIGGGAYGSMLGGARNGLTSYRDFTFDAERVGGVLELRYRETYVARSGGPVALPALFGVRLPAYDRTNGLSLPFGPMITLGRVELHPVATYRSQLGELDPSISGQVVGNRKMWVEAFIGRETRSNDDWIDNRFSNSMSALWGGRDERNWYRAIGGWATLNRMFETPTMTASYALGGSFERASAARPGPSPTSGPWSLSDRTDDQGMFRPNPQIAGGDIASVIGGATYRWTAGVVRARLGVDLEVPVSVSTGERFVQATIDGRVDFPTFGRQRYRMEGHGLITAMEAAPGQRFSYLGGSGTLPTEDVLSMGGDHLLWLENRYEIPVSRIVLPMVGSPIVTFRHILGGARLQGFPDLTQIIGIRVSVPALRLELLMDTETRKPRFTAGLALGR